MFVKLGKPPQPFVVSFRIDEQITKELMAEVVNSGYRPEQIARYALKRYLRELTALDERAAEEGHNEN